MPEHELLSSEGSSAEALDLTASELSMAKVLFRYGTKTLSCWTAPVNEEAKPGTDRPQAAVLDRVTSESNHLLLGMRDLLQVLIDRGSQIEHEFTEGGHVILPRFDMGMVLIDKGRDDDVYCRACAIIPHRGSPIFIDVEDPGVLDVLRSDRERPLSDRVRVAGQFVCIGCDAVRLGGLGKSFLREAVGLLGALIRKAGEEQAAGGDGEASDAEGNRDGFHSLDTTDGEAP